MRVAPRSRLLGAEWTRVTTRSGSLSLEWTRACSLWRSNARTVAFAKHTVIQLIVAFEPHGKSAELIYNANFSSVFA